MLKFVVTVAIAGVGGLMIGRVALDPVLAIAGGALWVFFVALVIDAIWPDDLE